MLSSCANTVGKSWVFGLCVFFLVLVKFDLSFSQSYTYTPLAAACDGVWTNGSCWSKNDDGYLTPSSSSFPPIGLNRPTSSFTSSNQIKVIFNDSFTMPSSFYFDANTVEIVIDEGAEFSIQGSWYLVKESNYLITANSPSGNSAFMNVWGGVFYQSKATLSLNDGSATSLPPYPTTLTFTTTRVAIPDTDKYNSFSLLVNKESLLRVSDMLSFPNAEKNKLIIDGGRGEINQIYLAAGNPSSMLDTNQINILSLGKLSVCSELSLEGDSYLFIDDAFDFDAFVWSWLVASRLNFSGSATVQNDGTVTFQNLSIGSTASITYGPYHYFESDGTPISYDGNEYLIGDCSPSSDCQGILFEDAPNIYYGTFLNFEDGFAESGAWCLNVLPVYLRDFFGLFNSTDNSVQLKLDLNLDDSDEVVLYRASSSNLNWIPLKSFNYGKDFEDTGVLLFSDSSFDLKDKILYYKFEIVRSNKCIFNSKILPVRIESLDLNNFVFYPNPSYDYIQIYSNTSSKNVSLSVMSLNGDILVEYKGMELEKINNELQYFSKSLKSGFYIFLLIDGGREVIKKIQKL